MDKYQAAWEKFQKKMEILRKKQKEVLARIFEKLDQQKLEVIRKKL
ncbi:MAG: hypothetical protein ACD_7C00251G0002 [uncultured bacterium]|nr:MAG: hypothetical protein ACD_7C00251G0002 [uncultured bacterium]